MIDDEKEKIQLKATKLYLSKLAEKYKSMGYENVFINKKFNFLPELKINAELINKKNLKIESIFEKNVNFIEYLSKNDDIDENIKNKLLIDFIDFFGDFVDFFKILIESEQLLIQNTETFRNLEKEIDTKTKALTKYGFNKEFKAVLEDVHTGVLNAISVIIFDQNNLKNINENYGHEIGQESIWKFGSLLREELLNSGFNYILSNYYGGDEWFLILIDISQIRTINFINKFFNKLKIGTYKIKNFDIKLGACAGITYYSHQENNNRDLFDTKLLLHITDTLVLQAKVQKNKNKSDFAYKAIDVSNFNQEQINKIYKKIQILPKKLKIQTLDKKDLKDLFEIRKKQNEKIMKARTLGVKKVLRGNIDLINEIIGQKIVEQITKTFKESRQKIINTLPKLSEQIYEELLKNMKKSEKNQIGRKEIINKVFKTSEIKKLIEENINIFNK
ncbi:diguanylate cyclase [Candidatus Gracilibacteria bacterium]|nr:diguanylate cyclase [Candidatus Gracilibacteria bacterium]